MQLTIKLRLRDKHAAELNRQARAVNFVWNYCNETQQKAARDGRPWLSGYDLQKLTAGSSVMLGLNARSINRVCSQYDRSRRQQKKPWLRFRSSKRNLGWVPFNTGDVVFSGQHLKFYGKQYKPMHLGRLRTAMKIGAGSFNRDSRGRWYINLPVEAELSDRTPISKAGIDLGLKTLATISDGTQIQMPSFYRASECALATAQSARKSSRARAIQAKIAARRKDFLHKASTALVKEYGLIFIGDVSSSKLAQTRMAKSVFDASWYDFKQMLSYKALMHGGRTIEVPEQYTSQVCSDCGCLPDSRPRGIADLGIRRWTCSECGADHDRDVNAARNIVRRGLATLAEGASLARRSQLARRGEAVRKGWVDG